MTADLARVSNPSVEYPPSLARSEVRFMIEAASQHFLAEGDDIWSLGQLKPLVAPHSRFEREI